MTRIYLKRLLAFLAGSIKQNWGAPFIALFILLLIVTAAASSMGLVSLADSVTIDAYYVLIAGVVLQFFCFIKYRKKRPDGTAT